MRRQIIVVFLSLFCLLVPPAWSADRGALFKVEGSGHTMYLFGTIHVGKPEFYPLEPRIVAAVTGASTLAVEVDTDANLPALLEARNRYGLYAAGAAAGDMTPDLRKRTRRALGKAGFDADSVANMRPWLLATVLAVAEYAAQGYRTDLSVESHLISLAKASKVPVLSLETAAEQLSPFDRLSEAEQLRFLDESVTQIESGRQRTEVRQIVEAWRTADRATFEAIAARAAADTTLSGRFFQQVLLDERNVTLAAKLAGLLQREDKAVAAIGMLHLVGGNSVPALLSARGLSVERVY